MWKWMLRFSALPKRWIKVTAAAGAPIPRAVVRVASAPAGRPADSQWGVGDKREFGSVVSDPTGYYSSVTSARTGSAMSTTTTLKLPEKLKARIARIARETRRSAHSIMIEALEREVAREERVREFVREALDANQSIEKGAEVYLAEDVHAWMDRLARNPRAPRPKPWRG